MKSALRLLVAIGILCGVPLILRSQEPVLKVGIIGLDTSHAIAFTKELNNPAAAASWPTAASWRLIPRAARTSNRAPSACRNTSRQIKKLDVEIVDSIDELLKRVDCVLLETNDGRPHLEQALPCFKAGKPTFIDKPIAGSLADAIAIFEAAKKYNCPVFSSSSLRYGKLTQAVRGGSLGKISRGRDDAAPPAGKDASRSVLVRHSRRRIAVHRDGHRLRDR